MRRSVKLVMAGLAAYGLYALVRAGRRGSEPDARRRGPRDAETEPSGSRGQWDEVDEASYESFPASDPPAYSRGQM